ncbi:Ig-like domain-containing protein [Nocardioides sp. SOB77]|uniref:Ig-like domain-containing protein n=1 Tax=Nocardioides oceani TaxID=3058369 RepID=A0ABT8FGR4_9ACTN|nr:Ig-like domain-containing protein [Nocardioides oceani]MDN4173645.1 Ig-like domain-containing protein [Nocardioides oceani]
MADTTTAGVHGPSFTDPAGAPAGAAGQTGPAWAWAGLVVHFTARAYRALLLTLAVVATLPLAWSWTSHVIRTGSMEPAIGVGDVVVARPFTDAEDVPLGRVMVFTNPAVTDREQLLVHRVVSDLGEGEWATAGDANREIDATSVRRGDLRSRAILLVPFVGKPFVWIADRNILPLAAWAMLTCAAFALARRGTARGPAPRPPARPKARRRPPAPEDRIRRFRRPRLVPADGQVLARSPLAVVALLALPLVWSGSAGASFTSTTATTGSTWSVAEEVVTSLTLVDPPDAVRGTTPLTAVVTGSVAPGTTVRIDYAPAGSTTWRTICTDTAAPYTCSWSTTGLANQEYDLRAVLVSGSATMTSPVVEGVQVDNVAPSVVLQDPGSPLRGVVTLTASASDAHSGVDQVVLQHAAAGSTTWRDACTLTEAPFSCRFDTTTVADGTYSFRAVATDAAGGTTTSAAVTGRTVDNRVASVSVVDPGAFLSGTVQVAASAYSPSGVVSVRVQRAATGTTAWTDLCTDTTAPYACSWNTGLVANGSYDLRAVMVDGGGRTTTSASVTSRRVDNSPLRAMDVQTVPGGATLGRIEPGDRLVLTYSGQAQPSTITSGWTGAAIGVTVRVRDGNLLGLGSRGDTLDVQRTGAAVNLGSVNLREDYVRSLRTALFSATMTATTTSVGGVPVTQVTIVLGAQTSGSTPRTSSTSASMVWTPSTAVLDLAGRPAAATPATETGGSDRDW